MVVNSWYNGYSSKERDDKYKVLKKLIKGGELKAATGPCDLCNDPDKAVEYHDEDYGLPYLWTKPALLSLCRHCHRTKLHKRFKNTENWYTFLAHIRRGGYASDLKNKSIKKELDTYKKACNEDTTFKLEILRPYKYKIGSEWFANIRMDIESLRDPNARLNRGKNIDKLFIKALAFAADKHKNQRRKDEEASPYINHPISLTNILVNEGEVNDINILVGAILHDTVEDTETTKEELQKEFGEKIASIVMEVTDDKSLPKEERKIKQIEHSAHISDEAKHIKLADKISNLRDIISSPPKDWSQERKNDYFEWAGKVIDQVRGTNSKLESIFDSLHLK